MWFFFTDLCEQATDQKQTLPEAVEGYRAAIARAVRDYVSANFTDGKCVSSTFGSEDGHVTVCLTGKNVHLGNFYSGSWRAVYKLDVSEEGKKAVECFGTCAHSFPCPDFSRLCILYASANWFSLLRGRQCSAPFRQKGLLSRHRWGRQLTPYV